jgi:hypothetical protein
VDELVGTIMLAATGRRPRDYDAAARDGLWLADWLMYAEQVTGEPDLYWNYLRVCGHVEDFDYLDFLDFLDFNGDGDDPSVEGVTFKDEVVLEDDKDIDDGGRGDGWPHLEDDMDRTFLALMEDSS